MGWWHGIPAIKFEESLPFGNGKLGALVYGVAGGCVVRRDGITKVRKLKKGKNNIQP
jgi:hypothetical protein